MVGRIRGVKRLAALGLAMTLLAACGDRSDNESASVKEAAGTGGQADGSVALGLVRADANAPVTREVIYTADLTVRVGSITRAAPKVGRAAEDAGGYVFSQATDAVTDEAYLTLKVPSTSFDQVMGAVAALGRVQQRSMQAQDVTAEVTDVEGRLATARISADRLRTLLADATTVADVVALEGELTKRETEIESLAGRSRVLRDQVELATINVMLTEREDLKVNDNLPGFRGGLRAGAVALLNAAQVLVVLVGFALPFAPFAVLAVWLVRRYLRRRRRRAAVGARSAEPQAGVVGEE